MFRRSNPQAQGGFTLIEVMIVVALIGIIAAAAVPSIVSMQERRRTQSVARTLTDHFRGLRHAAVNTNKAFLVSIEQGDGQGGQHKGKIIVTPSDNSACVPGINGVSNTLSLNLADLNDVLGRSIGRRNVQIVYTAPEPVVDLCFRPDGSIISTTTSSHVLPGSQSAGDCTGVGYPSDVTNPKHWKNRCGRAGTVCLKVAFLNENCPNRCATFTGNCSSHYGVDKIIGLNFSGETRVIQ
jgi:prepilin-type N-terminal cleavage/methylation domain-containing protein